ncbi:MAG: hypothetical protein ACLQVD_01215 [Capsulimonadaceae bacterium]
MSNRGRIDDPGVMDGILDAIDARPRQYWLDRLTQYEHEKPGDVVLPGVPPQRAAAAKPTTEPPAKKAQRKALKAA